jgi:hypothetical protein
MHAKFLAVDFVSLPIVSLTFCVAIPSHPAMATKLHLGHISFEAVIAYMRQVLGVDAHFTVAYRNLILILIWQEGDVMSPITEETNHNSKFPVVCCIAETLKPHQLTETAHSRSLFIGNLLRDVSKAPKQQKLDYNEPNTRHQPAFSTAGKTGIGVNKSQWGKRGSFSPGNVYPHLFFIALVGGKLSLFVGEVGGK